MTGLPRIVDVEDAPELLRLVEEVRETRDELIIRQGGENVAVLSPAKPEAGRRRVRAVTDEDIAAFRAAAGSWKDLIDADEFLEDVYERRKRWTRPPVKL